jgi:hypothetical protein
MACSVTKQFALDDNMTLDSIDAMDSVKIKKTIRSAVLVDNQPRCTIWKMKVGDYVVHCQPSKTQGDGLVTWQAMVEDGIEAVKYALLYGTTITISDNLTIDCGNNRHEAARRMIEMGELDPNLMIRVRKWNRKVNRPDRDFHAKEDNTAGNNKKARQMLTNKEFEVNIHLYRPIREAIKNLGIKQVITDNLIMRLAGLFNTKDFDKIKEFTGAELYASRNNNAAKPNAHRVVPAISLVNKIEKLQDLLRGFLVLKFFDDTMKEQGIKKNVLLGGNRSTFEYLVLGYYSNKNRLIDDRQGVKLVKIISENVAEFKSQLNTKFVGRSSVSEMWIVQEIFKKAEIIKRMRRIS